MNRGAWNRAGCAAAALGAVLLLASCGGDGGREVVAHAPSRAAAVPAPPGPLLHSAIEPAAALAPAPVASEAPAAPAPPITAPPVTLPAAPVQAAPPAVAANRLAVVFGVVSRGGQPLAGARVSLRSEGGAERATTADADGGYRFTDVEPGGYEVAAYSETGAECGAEGCISAAWAQRDEVTVAAGETRRVDITG